MAGSRYAFSVASLDPPLFSAGVQIHVALRRCLFLMCVTDHYDWFALEKTGLGQTGVIYCLICRPRHHSCFIAPQLPEKGFRTSSLVSQARRGLGHSIPIFPVRSVIEWCDDDLSTPTVGDAMNVTQVHRRIRVSAPLRLFFSPLSAPCQVERIRIPPQQLAPVGWPITDTFGFEMSFNRRRSWCPDPG